MLQVFEETDKVANIIGIDPGSQTLGFSVLTFDVVTKEIIKTQAKTFTGSKLACIKEWEILTHGERQARISAHGRTLLDLFNHYKPLFIACEAPFYNMKRPNAFQALLEVILEVRKSAMEYDPWRVVYLIDPPSVKKSVGASGGGDKEAVKKALRLKQEEIKLVGTVDEYDEHSLDSIAVAYCRFQEMKRSII
jgi:Holliday junction resolvasome RuvABC endonuclease subunit